MPRSALDTTVNLSEKAYCHPTKGVSAAADPKMEETRARLQYVGEEANNLATDEDIDSEPFIEFDVVTIPAYKEEHRTNSVERGHQRRS